METVRSAGQTNQAGIEIVLIPGQTDRSAGSTGRRPTRTDHKPTRTDRGRFQTGRTSGQAVHFATATGACSPASLLRRLQFQRGEVLEEQAVDEDVAASDLIEKDAVGGEVKEGDGAEGEAAALAKEETQQKVHQEIETSVQKADAEPCQTGESDTAQDEGPRTSKPIPRGVDDFGDLGFAATGDC